MIKNLTLVLIVIVTIGSTYALTRFVKMDSFAFAWILNFLLMIFASAFTEALKSPMNSNYYEEKEWERRGEIYENVGVNFFRKLLVWIGWEKLTKKANPMKKNTEALMHLHFQTKKSELGHVIVLVIVLGFNVFVAMRFGVLKSSSLLILNILLNLYPVLLQRYNRPRLARAISLSTRKESQRWA